MATNQGPTSRIRLLRENQGLTRSTVAAYLGISPNALYDWEMKSCKAKEILGQILLCEALRCHPEDLIDASFSEQSKPLDQIRQQVRAVVCSELADSDLKLKISVLRRSVKLSQEKLAAAIDIDYRTIQNWEKGRTSSQKPIDLIRLCEILKCKPKDLIDEIPESTIKQFCTVLNRSSVELLDNKQELDVESQKDYSTDVLEKNKLNAIRKRIRKKSSRLHTLDPKM